MRRTLFLIGLAAVVMAAAPRPPSELQLFDQLNGQPTRWRIHDGGSSGLFAAGAQTCFPLDGGVMTGSSNPYNPNIIMLIAESPAVICARPQLTPGGQVLPWDAGCNQTDTDINFGVPIQPYQPYYIVLQPQTTHICGASDAGAPLRVPAWGMQ